MRKSQCFLLWLTGPPWVWNNSAEGSDIIAMSVPLLLLYHQKVSKVIVNIEPFFPSLLVCFWMWQSVLLKFINIPSEGCALIAMPVSYSLLHHWNVCVGMCSIEANFLCIWLWPSIWKYSAWKKIIKKLLFYYL